MQVMTNGSRLSLHPTALHMDASDHIRSVGLELMLAWDHANGGDHGDAHIIRHILTSNGILADDHMALARTSETCSLESLDQDVMIIILVMTRKRTAAAEDMLSISVLRSAIASASHHHMQLL